MIIRFIILGIIFFIGGIALCVFGLKKEFIGDLAIMIIGIVIAGISLGTLICIPIEYTEYLKFEKSFEIAKETYYTIQENDNWYPDIYNVADIMSANKELFDYQAKKEMWGSLSVIPERVFNIVPIGVNE